MKANEAPEKIYISNFDIEALPKNEQLSERWYEVSTQDTDIEYTRTDAFIEEACEWLKECAEHYYGVEGEYSDKVDLIFCKEELIEDFKNYMKGE